MRLVIVIIVILRYRNCSCGIAEEGVELIAIPACALFVVTGESIGAVLTIGDIAQLRPVGLACLVLHLAQSLCDGFAIKMQIHSYTQ